MRFSGVVSCSRRGVSVFLLGGGAAGRRGTERGGGAAGRGWPGLCGQGVSVQRAQSRWCQWESQREAGHVEYSASASGHLRITDIYMIVLQFIQNKQEIRALWVYTVSLCKGKIIENL